MSRSKVLVFSNRKGGVGKTTSVFNLGACMSRKGKKVLLIDLDPQANLTQCFLAKKPEKTLFGVLLKEDNLGDTVRVIDENLCLLPSGDSLALFEREFTGDRQGPFIVKELLEDIQKKFSFDFIFLDCPPSMSLITVNAFVSGHVIYVPIEPQKFSLQGISDVQREVKRMKVKANKGLNIAGVFMCNYHERNILTQEIFFELKEKMPDLLMKNHVRTNISLKESPSYLQNIFQYKPRSNGAKDYEALTCEILEKLESHRP